MQSFAKQDPYDVVWVEPKPEPVRRGTMTMRRWRERNRLRAHHQSVVANHRTQSRRAGYKATLTFTQWWALLEAVAWCCVACGERTERLSLDRIKPHCRGGGTTLANVQPLCGYCNKSKGTKVIDYRKERAA